MHRTMNCAAATLSLIISAGAFGAIASTEALVVDITEEVGTPDGLTTYGVYIEFTSPDDVLLSHTLWNVAAHDGTFYNAHPVSDDPLGLIPDVFIWHPAPGSVPLEIPDWALKQESAYQVWSWDTHISMDGSVTQSSPEAVMDDFTPTLIGPVIGCFNPNPALPITAGADLRIQIAQITITDGGGFSGTLAALTPLSTSGADVTFITVDGPPDTNPCPSDLDGTGIVDGIDIAILLANWSIPPGSPGCDGELPCPMDFSGDGLVNGIDLGILLSHWGPCD